MLGFVKKNLNICCTITDYMPRDIFGRLVKSDIFGRKISKKQIKREVIDSSLGLTPQLAVETVL